MKKFYKALFLCVLCLAFASCAQDETAEVVASEGSVRLAFRVVDGVQTRATEQEDGWTDWNENLIDRLDLFLFNADGTLYKHIEKKKTDLNVIDNQDDEYTKLSESGLTYTEVASENYTYYMVANCESLAGFDGTLTKLKEKVTPDLVCNEKQSSFVMDDRIDKEDKDYQDHLIVDESNKIATLTFDLSRAAAKIRVSVSNADIDDCTFSLYNYVNNTFVLDKEDRVYNTEQCLSAIDMESVQKNGNQVVFYSYPNDWFDESKVENEMKEENGQMVETGKYIITDFVKEDPIVPDRQTYILLRAPYKGTDYYYKVPVNFSTYTNNDKVSFKDTELEEIRSLFRIDRNSIYDITVTIDREGGPISSPVTPTFYVRINDWNPGGDYNIGAGEFE